MACYIDAMTAQVLFNPLSYIDRLTRGGFSPEQARASAEALETAFAESVATKSDIDELRRDISSLGRDLAETESRLERKLSESEGVLRTEISSLEHKLGAEISSLENKLGAGISSLEHKFGVNISSLEHKLVESEGRMKLEISQSKNETLRWMFGFNIVLIGAIFTIMKFVR